VTNGSVVVRGKDGITKPATRTQVEVPGVGGAAAQAWGQWEYHEECFVHHAGWVDALNLLGQDGWLLLAIIHDETPHLQIDEKLQARLIFYRPKKKIVLQSRPAQAEIEEDDDLEEAEDEP
jgi:hypothetical protein